jgi:FAD/FMN-containing dehydrogenase
VYALRGTLFAVRFNLDKLEVVGGPVPVVEGVRRSTAAVSGSAHFDFSGSGSLVYLPGPASMGAQDLFLFDRKGNWEALKLPPGTYRYPRVSPDGKRVAVESSDDKEAFISVYDLSGTSSPRRLTFGSNNRFPIWSADGKRVAFQSDRNRSPAIFWQPIDGGPAEPLTKADPGTSHVPEAWSPVSDVVLFSIAKGAAILLWTGRVLTPSDDGYDAARSVFNAMIDRRPVLVVRCTNDDDVVAAVAVAREQNALVSVKCTGHNVAGFAVCDGGLAIDLSLMKSISVDPVGRTVRVGAGCTWGEVNDALQPHSLAAAGGFVSLTGVSGLTLGGGLGWLVRKHGLALDNLISARVVLADGRVVTASASENDDLFWALRGGGGNFGIVTEFEFRVHEGGSVLAGIALHPFAAARDVLRRWRDLEATAPEEFSGSALLLTFPQDPNAPEPLRGAALVGVGGVYAGAGPAAETAVGSLRAYGPPIADLFKVTPYNEVQRMADFAFPLGFRNYWKSSYLKGMSDGAIDVLVDHFERVPSPNTVIVLEHNGDGALERVPETATAFGHRGWPYNFIVTSAWSNPAETERNVTWTRELFAAMRPFMADALYVNYIGDEGADGVRAAYGSKYERLAMLKAKYDPDNLFRMNQNIKPAVGVTHAGA